MSLAVVTALEDLYEGVVMEPDTWTDERMQEWMASIDGESVDKEAIKVLTRGIRRAQRMRTYWAGRADGPPDWRARVDQSLAGQAWRVCLDLANWSLARNPDPAVFGIMAERFRWVKFEPYPLTYEAWLAQYSGPQ